jgi:hypothetical protein
MFVLSRKATALRTKSQKPRKYRNFTRCFTGVAFSFPIMRKPREQKGNLRVPAISYSSSPRNCLRDWKALSHASFSGPAEALSSAL